LDPDAVKKPQAPDGAEEEEAMEARKAAESRMSFTQSNTTSFIFS
jgi:hypothetical protein